MSVHRFLHGCSAVVGRLELQLFWEDQWGFVLLSKILRACILAMWDSTMLRQHNDSALVKIRKRSGRFQPQTSYGDI